MLDKNGIWGRTLKAIFGIVALFTVAGGLVSCDIGGEAEGEGIEQNEEEEDDD